MNENLKIIACENYEQCSAGKSKKDLPRCTGTIAHDVKANTYYAVLEGSTAPGRCSHINILESIGHQFEGAEDISVKLGRGDL